MAILTGRAGVRLRNGGFQMTITPEQVSNARWLLGWLLRGLAEVSKLSHNTIMNFENGKHRPLPANVATIRIVLEVAGVVFTNDGEPGVKLRKPE